MKEEVDRLYKWLDANTDQLPDDLIAMALNYDLITGILTKERIRIVNYLREHGPVDSLQELAQALDRDRSAVSRDLGMLENSLVEVTKNGRQKVIRATNRPIVIY